MELGRPLQSRSNARWTRREEPRVGEATPTILFSTEILNHGWYQLFRAKGCPQDGDDDEDDNDKDMQIEWEVLHVLHI